MKRRVDRLSDDDSVAWGVPALTPSVRGGASWARRRDDQTCGGGAPRWAPAASHARGRKPGWHPPRGERLAMPHEWQDAPLARWRLPAGQPSLRAQRLLEAQPEHATRQLTAGGGFLARRPGGALVSALPRLPQPCDWPAPRIDHEDRGGRPNRLGPRGAQALPGPPSPLPGGRCRAGVRGGGPGQAAPCRHDRCGGPRGHHARRHRRGGGDHEGVRHERALDHGQALGPRPRGAAVASQRVVCWGRRQREVAAALSRSLPKGMSAQTRRPVRFERR
jgi:hypothetical protein